MSSENLPPRVAKLIMREIRQLAKNPPDGVTFVPGDEDCLNEIYADIDGPEETPFFGGRFRLKLVIGAEFPMAPPKGYFLTKIYHPNVSDAGEICVNALKKDWKPDLGIAHVLKVIWCLLLVPFPESSLNDEAGKLFMESYGEYVKKARIWTKIHALKASGGSSGGGGGGGGAAAEVAKTVKAASRATSAGGLAPKEVNAENCAPGGGAARKQHAGAKVGGKKGASGAGGKKKQAAKKKTKTLKRL